MSDTVVANPFDFLRVTAAQTVGRLELNDCGWVSPNALRFHRGFMYIPHETVVSPVMTEICTLAIINSRDAFVFDGHVPQQNRFWERDIWLIEERAQHVDAFSPNQVMSLAIRRIVSMKPLETAHHNAVVNGRPRGQCMLRRWNAMHTYRGPLNEMPITGYGFVDIDALKTEGGRFYIAGDADVYPTIEGTRCLQVIHTGSKLETFAFDADVPTELRWWDQPHGDNLDAADARDFVRIWNIVRERDWNNS